MGYIYRLLLVIALFNVGICFTIGQIRNPTSEELGGILLEENYAYVSQEYNVYYEDGCVDMINGVCTNIWEDDEGNEHVGGYHPGIDYSASIGLNVMSPVKGVVHSVDESTWGRVSIQIDGTDTYFIFLHLSHMSVAPGNLICQGQIIGETGSVGAKSPHLHVEVREGRATPALYFKYNTDTGVNLNPTTAVDWNLKVEADGTIDSGNIKLLSAYGFGNNLGAIEITVYNPITSTDPVFSSDELTTCIIPTISAENWTDTEIRFNIFTTPLTFDKFVMPIRILIRNSNSEELGSIYYPFNDVAPDVWYSEFVTRLWKREIIEGPENTSCYQPAGDTNRAEFIKIAVGASNIHGPYQFEPTYNDVEQDDWFYPYVKAAWNLGWLDKTKTTFNPGDPINRAEVAKVISIARAFDDEITNSVFYDIALGEWYTEYVMWLYIHRIVDGYPPGEDGRRMFRPGNTINRAEVAKIAELAFNSDDY
jgi:murein DD-endopeptidase MepM/ murein hydrolase activator NlpD